jgi:hypothetical protein
MARPARALAALALLATSFSGALAATNFITACGAQLCDGPDNKFYFQGANAYCESGPGEVAGQACWAGTCVPAYRSKRACLLLVYSALLESE